MPLCFPAENTRVCPQSILSNGRLYVMRQPINLGWATGPRFQYGGVMPWTDVDKANGPNNYASVFVYIGDATQPGITSGSDGAVFDGMNFWRRGYSPTLVQWDGSRGFLFKCPASSTTLQNMSLAGWDTAITLGKSNHVEHFTLTNLHSHANRVFLRNEENQAVCHSVRGLFSYREFETLFEFAHVPERNGGGGNFSTDTVVIQTPGRIFDIEKSNSNSCSFFGTNYKIDGAEGNQMKGWRLIRQRNGPLNFTLTGHIGKLAEPAQDAIDVEDKSNLDVRMFWRGKIWPRDFNWNGEKWV